MKTIRFSVLPLFTILAFPLYLNAQQPVPSATSAAVVPRLVSFSGKAVDAQGKPLSGIAGVTFTIYKGQSDGAPLWMETQNVQADSKGNYSIQLGATKSDGLPVELFASGEARWLGVRVNGGEEQARVMLLSVPYALKAGDAATIGGLPPSAFVLAAPPSAAAGTSGDVASSNPVPGAPPPASTVTMSGGTVNALPLWTTATNVQSSAITQTGIGATAKIGINTTAPTTALDVHGGSAIRGTLVLPATGAATASAGKVSQPENFVASSFSSATSTPVNQTFQWQATPTNNNTSTPGATLNLLYGLGATAPAQTGLRIGPKGIIGFAPGQTFPGTVKSVGLSAPGSDFTVNGSPVTGTGTLNFAWTVAPTSADKPNAIVKRDSAGALSTGPITASQVTAGPIFASIMGLGTTTPAERLDLGNDGNVVIRAFPGDDTTPDNVAYNLIGRGTGGQPQKWSIFTAPVGGGFGVPANSLSVWEYPANTINGCCLQRFTILPTTSSRVHSVFPVSIDEYGNLAVGYIDAAGKILAEGDLETDQNFYVSRDAQVLGCVIASQTVIGGTCSSDIRLKKNIRPYPAVLHKLVQLQPVSYEWRANEFPQYHFGSSRASGLIAQEVEKVFPEMVSEDENGFKKVNYSQLPYLMLEAIRELKAENDNLQGHVQADEERIRQMAARTADRSDELTEVTQLRAEVQRLARLVKTSDSLGNTGTGKKASVKQIRSRK